MCNLCRAGQFGLVWTRQIMTGDKTIEEAARFFKMAELEVMEHINEHEIRKDDPNKDVYYSDDIYMGKLLKSLNYLDTWINFVASEEPSKSTIDSLVRLTKEIRETVKTAAEFQGRLDTSTKILQVDKLETKILNITNLVLEEACPECRAKIVGLLD